MDDSDPSTQTPPSALASASDSTKTLSTHSLLPPPLYDATSGSDDEEDDDDFDDPHYPNRALQLPTPPTSPKASNSPTATFPKASNSPASPPRSRSPPRRPRLLSQTRNPCTPPRVPLAPSLSASSSSSSSSSSSPSSSPSPPSSSPPPIIPLLPAHGAPSFTSPLASASAAGPGPSAASSSCPRPPSPPVTPFSVIDIQRRIRLISRDSNLSENEKNHQRQAILSQPFQQRRKKEAIAFSAEMHRQRHVVTYSDVENPETGKKMPGCEHYPRNCKIKADCCGLWVVCRLCHDHPSMDHAINRFDSKEVMCMLCFAVQPVSRRCINVECGKEFARYFCGKCKFYDNTPGKDIYHCDKCQICRVGKGIGHDNFHCDRCDACVSREYSKTHRCLKKSLDANCPICGLYLFTSTKPVVFMRCGHTMHSHCFDTYTAEHYICPLCHKALTNMRPYYAQIDEAMRQEVMPSEHQNKVSEVLCHDCDKRSETPFHFLYLKCQTLGCGSYNTRLLRTYEKGFSAAANASASDAAHMDVGSGPVEEDDVVECLDNDDDDDIISDNSNDEGADMSSMEEG